MEFCEYFEIYIGEDLRGYAIGQVTKATVNQMKYWVCNMIAFDAILKASIPIALLAIYICRNFSQRRDWTCRYIKNSFCGYLNHHSEKTLANYVSDKPCLRIFFYCYSYYAFFFGFQMFMLCEMYFAKLYYSISDDNNMATALIVTSLLKQFMLILGSGFALMLTFLVTMIGAKEELLVFSKDPIRGIKLEEDQKKVVVRSNLHRAVVILLLIFSSPTLTLLPTLIVKNSNSDDDEASDSRAYALSYSMAFALFVYYTIVRFSFMSYEKTSMQLQTAQSKFDCKLLTINRFLTEYSIKNLFGLALKDMEVAKVEANSQLLREKFIAKLNLNAHILEQKMVIAQNDAAVPMPQNMGDINLYIKLLLAVSCAIFLPVLSIIASYFTPYGDACFFWSWIAFCILSFFVSPILSTRIFQTQHIFGGKSSELELTAEDDFEGFYNRSLTSQSISL